MEKLSSEPNLPDSFSILTEAGFDFSIISERPFKVTIPFYVADIAATRRILTTFTDKLEAELNAKSSSILECSDTRAYHITIGN